MSYGCCLICATCATYGQVAGTHNMWKMLKDDLKCYFSRPNNESKLLKRISDYIIEFVCGYATCATFWNTFGKVVYAISPKIPSYINPLEDFA